MTAEKTRPETDKARLILEHAQEAKKSLVEQCDASRKARRATGGALSHAEQDLLRAMLVFAGAGLDALLKQLIRDSLSALAAQDEGVQAELETFVGRQLRGEGLSQPDGKVTGRDFLAHVLVAAAPLARIVEEYIKDLTGDSLQSADQLFRAVKALGIDPKSISLDGKGLKVIFEARNQIIHELDIVFDTTKKKARKRRSRTVADMADKAEQLLLVGEHVITAVEAKLDLRA